MKNIFWRLRAIFWCSYVVTGLCLLGVLFVVGDRRLTSIKFVKSSLINNLWPHTFPYLIFARHNKPEEHFLPSLILTPLLKSIISIKKFHRLRGQLKNLAHIDQDLQTVNSIFTVIWSHNLNISQTSAVKSLKLFFTQVFTSEVRNEGGRSMCVTCGGVHHVIRQTCAQGREYVTLC